MSNIILSFLINTVGWSVSKCQKTFQYNFTLMVNNFLTRLQYLLK